MFVVITYCAFYPGKTGAELRKLLKANATVGHKALGYTRARQEMYGYVYNDPTDQAVYDIYTRSRMPCAYDSMDTQCNKDLNCEHVVPQSLFNKKDPMVSDLHHLRATWMNANNARSNFPFHLLKAENVDKWFGTGFQTKTDKPKDPENWSKLEGGTAFEPADYEKGDIARAVAYFWTRYPTEAGSINKVISVDEMIDWEQQFPITASQLSQYKKAVEVQGNINPYQEERGLVGRAYCDLSTRHPCGEYL